MVRAEFGNGYLIRFYFYPSNKNLRIDETEPHEAVAIHITIYVINRPFRSKLK